MACAVETPQEKDDKPKKVEKVSRRTTCLQHSTTCLQHSRTCLQHTSCCAVLHQVALIDPKKGQAMAMMMSRTKLTPSAASRRRRRRRSTAAALPQPIKTTQWLVQVREGLLKCDPKVLAPEIIKMLIKQVRAGARKRPD